ncbi:hypothetical protein [Pseudomonas sp. DP16D-R1]|uniref:hypothetical protein n=1 Tax=Pseudomonas sp. DP16D-R1 TaxID=2075551 RepID=UPI000CD0E6FB|nr:hypothetical protein [Pseudomonas sp. DP16D-R1]POA78010.1 hypothetical protein C1890_12395 [Pseudomonas sp. DP16D-R1]
MSPKLAILQRRMNFQPEQAPVPEGGHGLGVAIEQLIADEVSRRVGEAMQQSPKVQRLLDDFNRPKLVTDFKQLPPVQKTAPAKNMSALIHRDGAGLARWIEVNGVKFEAMRDATGSLLGMRQVDEIPVLPALDIPFKPEAREYNESR